MGNRHHQTQLTMENLAKAVIAVIKEVKGIEKNLNVGSGNMGYKGVADADVKKVFRDAMAKNGLCLLPIGVEPTVHVERWEEDTNYGKKMKQSVFTEVKARYLLLHESGESQVLEGYGHGADPQDKSAGKATTYAMKYCLLYTFMAPTGDIDDTDSEHSDSKPVPQKKAPQKNGQHDTRDWLNPGTDKWAKAVEALKGVYTLPQIKQKYRLSKENEEKLLNEAAS